MQALAAPDSPGSPRRFCPANGAAADRSPEAGLPAGGLPVQPLGGARASRAPASGDSRNPVEAMREARRLNGRGEWT